MLSRWGLVANVVVRRANISVCSYDFASIYLLILVDILALWFFCCCYSPVFYPFTLPKYFEGKD